MQTRLAAFRYQTFSVAFFPHNDDADFLIYTPFTVPETASRTDLELGRQNQFFSHFVLDGKPCCRVG
jgi:hypothetical protein